MGLRLLTCWTAGLAGSHDKEKVFLVRVISPQERQTMTNNGVSMKLMLIESKTPRSVQECDTRLTFLRSFSRLASGRKRPIGVKGPTMTESPAVFHLRWHDQGRKEAPQVQGQKS